MSKKVLKSRIQFTSTLRKDLYAAVQDLSAETDIPISKLFDRAVERMLLEQTMTSLHKKVHPNT